MKTDQLKIPELNLFHSSKHRSPVNDRISYHECHSMRNSNIYRNYRPELDICKSSHISYDSTERPLIEGAMVYPRQFHDYIKPPSTYLAYADEYLAYGYPLHLPRNIETGRFNEISARIQAQTNCRRSRMFSQISPKRIGPCQCELDQQKYGPNFNKYQSSHKECKNHITNQTYLHPKLVQMKNKKPQKQDYKKRQQPKRNPYLDLPSEREHEKHEYGQREHVERENNNRRNENNKIVIDSNQHIKKETNQTHNINETHNVHETHNINYNINIKKNTENDNNKQEKKKPGNFILGFFGKNQSDITQKQQSQEDQRHSKHEQHREHHNKPESNTYNLSIGKQKQKHQLISEGTQTIQKKKEVNRSSVLIEKMMRTIPTMLDEQAFKKIIKQQTLQFNNIRIDFDDDYPVIDFEDLVQTKQQYMEYSKDLLIRLNKLSASPLAIIGQLFEKKTKKGMIWPDIQQHYSPQKHQKNYF